jgi:16S rRNA (cytidine1402-2'-O)-methyltransferase
VVGRELTKKFEELARLPLGEAPQWLAARPERGQGEFVLVLAQGAGQARPALDPDKVLEVLLDAVAPSEAARLAARITGAPKNVLYRKTVRRVK